jgi:hypothetical protein
VDFEPCSRNKGTSVPTEVRYPRFPRATATFLSRYLCCVPAEPPCYWPWSCRRRGSGGGYEIPNAVECIVARLKFTDRLFGIVLIFKLRTAQGILELIPRRQLRELPGGCIKFTNSHAEAAVFCPQPFPPNRYQLEHGWNSGKLTSELVVFVIGSRTP